MKITILANNKGQLLNPHPIHIGETIISNPEWDIFCKANPPLDLTSPNDNVGAVVDATIVEYCSCTNEFMLAHCDHVNDFKCEAKAFQLTPVKEGEEKRCDCNQDWEKGECQYWENDMCVRFGAQTIQPEVVATPDVDREKDIIANFMDLKPAYAHKKDIHGYTQTVDGYLPNEFSLPVAVEDLTYDSDWNLLMRVVEKIESLGYSTNIKYDQDEKTNMVSVMDFSTAPVTVVIAVALETKLLSVYMAVIAFIKWYNLNDK